MSALSVRRLEPAELEEFSPRVAALERGITYPLGEDRFEIDHGRDYFAFFERLGVDEEAVRYYVAMDGDTLCGVLAAVLRRIPLHGGGFGLAWYVCDLKASRPARTRIAAPLARAFSDDAPSVTSAAYAVSMNTSAGENRVVPFLSRVIAVKPNIATTLFLYSQGDEFIREHRPLLVEHLGAIAFLDLRGTKDIVLQSTGRPLPLLHLQHGPLADLEHSRPEPVAGAVHMFCVPKDSALVAALAARKVSPSASATVITYGAIASSFDFVQTSDI